jgi:hypothetical protein
MWKKNSLLLMLMAFLTFAKWWTFITTKIVTSLIFIINAQKNWIEFIMISKMKLKSFQINLILKLFMCLMLELEELLFKKYSLTRTFFNLTLINVFSCGNFRQFNVVTTLKKYFLKECFLSNLKYELSKFYNNI